MSHGRNYHRSIIKACEYDDSEIPMNNSSNINQNYNRSLINPVVASNDIDDEEIAQQHQVEGFYEVLKLANEPTPEIMPSIDMRPLEEIDADTAYAFQLQEEEYAKNSIPPFLTHEQNSNDTTASDTIVNVDDHLIVSDAEYAAHLQAEENQKQQKHNQRRIPHSTTNRNHQSRESENIPIPPFLNPTNHHPSFGENNNRFINDLASLIRTLASNSLPSHGHRNRNGNIENTEEDFGPDDYENLLELDESVRKKVLSNDEINRLPTETFRRLPNTSAEENQCSICWDDFELNQTLRRLPCVHRYHQTCIDNWLKTSNLCPLIKVIALLEDYLFIQEKNFVFSLETDDESFLDSGFLEHLIECYPITTAEDVSVISILCDICLNEYKSDDKR
ncbi:unnamed protein product [Rotaria sordida]|uniref:RING-type domain-containing protein n=1 Tax=Rotaria sordida TaxID=392033 RepID=A0A814W324_9BILA|nr:unnamed protein product [Rotaria sordida]